MKKILVTGSSVDEKFLEPLKRLGFEVRNPTHLLSEEELATELSDSVGYLLGGDEFASATAMQNAPGLKVITFLGVGYESFVDINAARRFGITVTNTPGTLTNSVAEFTVGHLLNARRRLTEYCNAFANGKAGKEEKQKDLAGHIVGIVGLGTIGTRIAEILVQGFHSKVCYFSRTRKPIEEDRLGIEFLSLQELAKASEALIIMVPGNAETTGLISERITMLMQKGAILVNTSRPDIIAPEALAKGLESETISVAAFDGFYEGSGDTVQRLRSFMPDRLLVTGHIGSLTHDARDAMAEKAINSLCNLLTGKEDACVAVQGNR